MNQQVKGDSGLKDKGASAYIDQINNGAGTSGQSTHQPANANSVPIQPATPSNMSIGDVPPVNHGGQGNGGGAGGHGGTGGNNQHGGGMFRSAFRISYLMIFVTLISILSVVWMNLTRSSPEGMKLQAVEQATDQLKELRLTEEAKTKRVKYQSERGDLAAVDVSRPPGVEKFSSVAVKTFGCETIDATTAVFAGSSLFSLDADKTYRIPSGCSNISPKVKVLNLSGADFILYVADSAIAGNYFKCGTYGGYSDSLLACRNFLNLHRGEKVHVSILDGGYLLIN